MCHTGSRGADVRVSDAVAGEPKYAMVGNWEPGSLNNNEALVAGRETCGVWTRAFVAVTGPNCHDVADSRGDAGHA
jgi:hypothetical protein